MNLLDYLGTEFAPFEEKPFNPVDAAILSQFCMVRGDNVVPPLKEKKAFLDLGTIVENLLAPISARKTVRFADLLRAELYPDMFTGLVPGLIKDNLLALAASPRFRDLAIRDYLSLFDTERQTQFSAVTLIYKKEFAYVGFRGTDSSFTGWKENFNMVFAAPVPAQEQAVRYLEAVAPRLPRRLFVGGHSKGGNLAVYAALKAQPAVRERIERVYNHDGPGFREGLIAPDEYDRVVGRIHKTVPQDSLVGMLMESREPLHVVKSTAKGIDQHSPFTWEVEGDDFAYLEDVTESAKLIASVFDGWLGEFSEKEAAVVTEAFFEALDASGAQDASDVFNIGANTVQLLREAAKNTRGETRDVLVAALKTFADVAARRLGENVAGKLFPKKDA